MSDLSIWQEDGSQRVINQSNSKARVGWCGLVSLNKRIRIPCDQARRIEGINYAAFFMIMQDSDFRDGHHA
jgi:hypothetical protein